MPTKQPRIQVTLDQNTNHLINILAQKKHLSVSATALTLIQQSLELQEDLYFSKLADGRDTDQTTWIAHDDAWK